MLHQREKGKEEKRRERGGGRRGRGQEVPEEGGEVKEVLTMNDTCKTRKKTSAPNARSDRRKRSNTCKQKE